MSKKQTKLRLLIFSMIVFMSFFLLLEGLTRLIIFILPSSYTPKFKGLQEGIIISDNVLNHKWRPSIKVRGKARGIETVMYVNGQSWVGQRNVNKKKPKNTYRIFYVGDSNVSSVVPWGKQMASLVENSLNQYYESTGVNIEVINTGTSSYSPIIYFLLIKEKILDYSPDLIIICVDMTDVINDKLYKTRTIHDADGSPLAVLPFQDTEKQQYLMTPEGILKLSRLQSWNKGLLENSKSYRLISNLLNSLLPEKKVAYTREWLPWHAKLDDSGNWLANEWTDDVYLNVEYTMKVIKKTIRLLQKNNIRVVLTGVPHYPQYDGTWSTKPHHVLAKTAAKVGCHYLNSYEKLKDAIAGTPLTEFYWATDPTHFNVKGNSHWADTQVKFLLSNKDSLLPRCDDCFP
ncbi:MAG: hypothetical protein PVH37_08610 [Desulfobacterales bacterium]|jgi:lysophospholipase L1-like esterase